MASIFKALFQRRTTQFPASGLSSDDSYQTLSDNQPGNVYREARLLYGHDKPVRHLELIDNYSFVSASDDNKVIVWDSVTGRCKHILERHTAAVTCVLPLPRFTAGPATSGDDPVIMTSSHNELILWELNSDERFDPQLNLKVIDEHKSRVNCLVALKPTGMICSGGENVCLWDYSGKLLSSCKRSSLAERDYTDIHSILQMEGRNFGIIAASDCPQPAVYDIKKSTVTQQVCYQLEFCRYLMTLHHESITTLVPVSGTFFASGSVDGSVVIWSMNSLSAIKLFNCNDASPSTPTTPPPSPLSSSLGSSSTSSWQIVHSLLMLCERYLFVAYSCGFKVFDVISSEGFNDSHSSTISYPLACHRNAHRAPITHFEFLTNSCQLATTSQDGTLRLWGSRAQLTPTKDSKEARERMAVDEFLSMSTAPSSGFRVKRRSQQSGQPIVPLLTAEMGLNSGTVWKVRDLGEQGLVTCGTDGVIILWKNLQVENDKRNQEIQKYLKEDMFYDASLLMD